MDATAHPRPIDIAAHRRVRNGMAVEVAGHRMNAAAGPRTKLAERNAARAVRMQPDQLEALARVVHATLAEYAAIQAEDEPPRWSDLPESARLRVIARVERWIGGDRASAAQLAGMQLVDVRRYRLLGAVIAAATAAA